MAVANSKFILISTTGSTGYQNSGFSSPTCFIREEIVILDAGARFSHHRGDRIAQLIPVQRFIPPTPKSPVILYVHGGPFGAINPDDPFILRLLAEGVKFVCVAYRGTVGYGLEYAEANRGEYGRADVWDMLDAGSDWKKRTGEDRPLIVAGYSYGGFLTFLVLAQEEIPWAGGITLYAVSGIHRMGLHQQRAFPTEADQQAAAWIARSPLQQAGRIRVPLLIFHGVLDTVATTAEMKFIGRNEIHSG